MISIVIPTHRRVDLLSRLLDSIAAQTYLDYEIIVVDDASPNRDEYDLLTERAKQRFERFRYVRLEANSGAPHARNVGIRLAQGDWIALVDDDDEWCPEKLERQQGIAQRSSPQVGLIYTWTRAVDGAGNFLYDSKPEIEGPAARQIFTTNYIMSPSVMVRKEAFDRVGLFDESLPSCQDWDMWARVLDAGYECRVVREMLSIYHRHGGASVGLSARARQGYAMFIKKHWRPILRHTSPLNWLRKGWLFLQTAR